MNAPSNSLIIVPLGEGSGSKQCNDQLRCVQQLILGSMRPSCFEDDVKGTHGSNGFEQKVVYDVDYRHECRIVRIKDEVVIEGILVGGHERQLERSDYCLARPEKRSHRHPIQK